MPNLPDSRPWLSIVIPTRRLDERLAARIRDLLAQVPGCEVVVVQPDDPEPGSTRHPLEPGRVSSTARGEAARVRLLRAPRGRGPQCNRGAGSARAGLLLFLHDDTGLPPDAAGLIEQAFGDPRVEVACFRLGFDRRHWLLGIYAFFSRFDSFWTTFGDQGLVIRRTFFERLGRFPDWPLFEDVELCRRARRRTRIVKLPAAVKTSAARFERNGAVRQQAQNAWLLLRFLSGATPKTLATRYEKGTPPAGTGARDD